MNGTPRRMSVSLVVHSPEDLKPPSVPSILLPGQRLQSTRTTMRPRLTAGISCEESLVPAEMEPAGEAGGTGGESEESSTLGDFSDREDGGSEEPQKGSEFRGSRRSKTHQQAYKPCASESELEDGRTSTNGPDEPNNHRINANNWCVAVVTVVLCLLFFLYYCF